MSKRTSHRFAVGVLLATVLSSPQHIAAICPDPSTLEMQPSGGEAIVGSIRCYRWAQLVASPAEGVINNIAVHVPESVNLLVDVYRVVDGEIAQHPDGPARQAVSPTGAPHWVSTDFGDEPRYVEQGEIIAIVIRGFQCPTIGVGGRVNLSTVDYELPLFFSSTLTGHQWMGSSSTLAVRIGICPGPVGLEPVSFGAIKARFN